MRSFRPIFYIAALVILLLALYTTAAQTPEAEGATAPQTEETASETRPGEENIWQVILKGGWTMLPLALISTLVAAFALERYFFFRRKKLDVSGYHIQMLAILSDGGLEAAEKHFERDDRLISRILGAGLAYRNKGPARVERELNGAAQVEIGNLERGLNLLANLGNLAPLLGFLGTVVGMRHSFLQFVLQAAPTAQDLAGGVEEALITTVAGLMIAIPTYLIYNLFIFRIDTFTNEVERCAQMLLSRLD